MTLALPSSLIADNHLFVITRCPLNVSKLGNNFLAFRQLFHQNPKGEKQ